MDEKKCKGPCGRMLPATTEHFWAAKTGKYGLQGKCKACQSLHNKPGQRRWYDARTPGHETQESQRAYYQDQKLAAERERKEPLDDFDMGLKLDRCKQLRYETISIYKEI